jgi:TolB protein
MVLSKGGNTHLWVTNLDGSGAVQLTRGTVDASSPCWSPDGRSICFASTGGGRPSLYTISAGGGSPKKIATGVLGTTEPNWSPDGRSIAFTQMSGRENFKVLVVPASGGDAQVVADGEDPSWGPNSRTLAINVRKNNERRLRLLDVPTRQYKDLPLTSGSCSQPSWGR